MKVTVKFVLATLVLFSGLALAATPPGINDLMLNWDPKNTGGTTEEVREQVEERERLEAAASALRDWWNSQQKRETPIPYLKHDGKKIPIPDGFIVFYKEAREKNQQKKAWRVVEKFIMKGVFKK